MNDPLIQIVYLNETNLSKNNSTYTKKSKSDIKLDSIDISPLKFINYPFDDVKYIIIGGLIIMDLSINHILSYPLLLILPQYKKDEKYLIITSKIPTNNTIDKYNTITFPSIISEIKRSISMRKPIISMT